MRSILSTALALALPLATASAQNPAIAAAVVEKRFKQLDANADGKLDAEEAKSVALLLRGADANGDGLLTIDEVRTHLRSQIASLVEARRGTMAADASQVSEKAPEPYVAKDSPREEPRRLAVGESGIGRMIADSPVTTLDGATKPWRELVGSKPAVIALVSTSCPVGKRYLPTLGALERDFTSKGVSFLLVAQNPTDTDADLRAALKAAGLSAPCVRDPQHTLLKSLGATSATDAFVVDQARTLVYRGAVDDQYGLGYSREAATRRYLAAALEATLAGRAPDIAATEAPGCALDLGEAKAVAGEVTYHNRISRLVQTNCQECHRSGGIAPFALETYEQVTAKAGMIRKMVDRGLMPPWFAAPQENAGHSPWANDRTLAASDKRDLLAWLDAGKPLGNVADAPLPRTFPAEWAIGTPDAIVQIPNPIEVKATGTMPYQMVTVDTSFGETKWVRGFEIKPTARDVVHHVLVFALEPGQRGRALGEGDETGGFFAAYVPGNDHVIYPSGFAKELAPGTRLRFQIHYTPSGTATRDQVRLGMIFAKEAPQHTVRVAGISNHRLKIPAGAAHHPESAVIPIPADVKLLAFTPHMHLRGSAFRYEAILPGGEVRTLLDIPRYDFNWQLSYRYAEPPTIPRGAKVRATGWFDNSANNPANPDPSKTVGWGPQTFDEMMLGYVEYYLPDEKIAPKTASR